MLLWLKIGGLLGARRVTSEDFRWGAFIAALVAGAVLAVLAQAWWAWIGKKGLAVAGHSVPSRHLRLLWGVAAFPQVAALFVLFPLDLLIVGTDSYATTRLADSIALTWAAISIALGVVLGAWCLYLFFCGLRVVTGDARRAGELLALAVVNAGLIVLSSSVLLIALAEATL